ncbi:Adipokinetic hormone/red pigment-concentrating hormone,Adipokinetic hormone, conserved site [Cinara cedri]|uniref:Adipokinetic hormone/red pigment-concentrating hormone,Adipokinetic hormone, conserved site n=1 Tax=Cinara cedri TaxID=506608 RepID=A0A5E4MD51_9HEMI|nr:Adipokinetic hormone/red pigment-concentrating hormone,Adipokinetic hormone, conserved site [Cinara cedri]
MRTLLLLAVFLLCACIAAGQVNFTPTWGQGKRNAPSAASVQAADECKSMDTLIYIYKLVQNEAQRIAMCERMSTS